MCHKGSKSQLTKYTYKDSTKLSKYIASILINKVQIHLSHKWIAKIIAIYHAFSQTSDTNNTTTILWETVKCSDV